MFLLLLSLVFLLCRRRRRVNPFATSHADVVGCLVGATPTASVFTLGDGERTEHEQEKRSTSRRHATRSHQDRSLLNENIDAIGKGVENKCSSSPSLPRFGFCPTILSP